MISCYVFESRTVLSYGARRIKEALGNFFSGSLAQPFLIIVCKTGDDATSPPMGL
jgi:hypothetical protein